jgi:hypothetical protein
MTFLLRHRPALGAERTRGLDAAERVFPAGVPLGTGDPIANPAGLRRRIISGSEDPNATTDAIYNTATGGVFPVRATMM